MKKSLIFGGVLVLTLSLSSCGIFPSENKATEPSASETISEAKASISAEASEAPQPSTVQSPSATASRTEVVWADYPAGTKDQIDLMSTNSDCLGLQSFFGMIAATEEEVKSRTGHGNEAITKYLNEAIAIAKC